MSMPPEKTKPADPEAQRIILRLFAVAELLTKANAPDTSAASLSDVHECDDQPVPPQKSTRPKADV